MSRLSRALAEAVSRGVVVRDRDRVTYRLKQERSYRWSAGVEAVRAEAIAFLVTARHYPPGRMRTDVEVAGPGPGTADRADLVVYEDDACEVPYLVVAIRPRRQPAVSRARAVGRGLRCATALGAGLLLYQEGGRSLLLASQVGPAGSGRARGRAGLGGRRLGSREAVPAQYGRPPAYHLTAAGPRDIVPLSPARLEVRLQQAHSIIWAGGRRDPLVAFDEWSKLLFAKAADERTTQPGAPRRFQVGAHETDTAVGARVRRLFAEAARQHPDVFPDGCVIALSDPKVAEVVRVLEDVAFLRADLDALGVAFEHFFGSVFRGQLGQYFTRRELARFVVGMLAPGPDDHVLDPTAGSGGFLLEAAFQARHAAAGGAAVRGRVDGALALEHLHGIEIHEVLARVCKINLLLHLGGHPQVEAGRSCLDARFSLPRLNPPRARFSLVLGNPPFGDEVKAGDRDKLGETDLAAFELARGRASVDSEHLVLERAVDLLRDGGRLGLVLPDGTFNNQGEISSAVRRYLFRHGFVLAVVSLPDLAFRNAGAQNKTSILFYRKFTSRERRRFEVAAGAAEAAGQSADESTRAGLLALDHLVFLAEADHIGYTPAGEASARNDLYRAGAQGELAREQGGTVLGEYRRFEADPRSYRGAAAPGCMAVTASALWSAHPSHRIDPKYHLFKREEGLAAPPGWRRRKVREVMRRRGEVLDPARCPEQRFVVMTLGQSGEVRHREAGKGRSPPEWKGLYFGAGSTWQAARAGDVVYSSIDLWKGCIAVVPPAFDGALVTSEFPIYEITDPEVSPELLAHLLRTRYFQRAFRAITTGHSNRRRTQREDFEDLDLCLPPSRAEQEALIAPLSRARVGMRQAQRRLRHEQDRLSDLLDAGRAEAVPVLPADRAAAGRAGRLRL